jgi:hypothetical protein
MRKWLDRIRGRESSEKSEQTNAELNVMEKQVRQYEIRVEYLKRERALYEERQKRRGITG